MFRVYAYVRVSTREQAEEGASLDAQEAACRAYALDLGATSIEVFRDEGKSGSSLKRPAMQELIRGVRDGGCEAVVVWKLDRLSRSVADWSYLFRLLTEHQVGFASATERIDATTPFGKAMLSILSVFAELFLDILRENVRSALAHIAGTGRRPTGVVYGYRRQDGHLVSDPHQAEIVREVFRRFVAGESMAAIGRDLQARRVDTKRKGKFWDATAIRDILRNPVYAGKITHRGEVLEGTHEALVSDDEWENARALREGRARNRGQAVAHFSALCRCGLCGGYMAAMTVQRSKRDGSHLDYYLNCGERFRVPPSDRHPGVGIAELKLSAVLWRHTELLLQSRDLSAAVRQQHSEHDDDSKAIERRIADLDELCRQNLAMYRQKLLSFEALQAENGPYIEEQERLKVLLSERGRQQAASLQQAAAVRPRSVAGFVKQMRGRPVEEQMLFLGALYRQVDVYRGHIVIHYQGDILPAATRSTAFRYAPRLGITDVGF